MKVNVYGLGYVGSVVASCLANEGNTVCGIDVDQTKVTAISRGSSPIGESGLEKHIKAAVASGNLTADTVPLERADLSIVCVGTPSKDNGSQNLNFIKGVAEQLGHYIGALDVYHMVSIRSTVLPGTVDGVLVPILERYSGKHCGPDFGICMNPEFLREGTSLIDYYSPPFTLIGEHDQRSGDLLEELYAGVKAPLYRKSILAAEMVKYMSNAFHALKVTFANEMGSLCKMLGICSQEVTEVFLADKKLNISDKYLKPGFAFGGSCLPKDLRALLYKANELNAQTPVLSAILLSNEIHIQRAYQLIRKTGCKRVGIIGLSFKEGTDDLRESPMVELVETLIGKGFEVAIYDAEVSYSKLIGSNKRYIEGTIPHISRLMKDSIEEVIELSEAVVLGSKSLRYSELLSRIGSRKHVIDLVDMNEPRPEKYEGICW